MRMMIMNLAECVVQRVQHLGPSLDDLAPLANKTKQNNKQRGSLRVLLEASHFSLIPRRLRGKPSGVVGAKCEMSN